MKVCKNCGERDQANFYATSHYCRPCHREWTRDSRIRKYGLTRADYDAMLAKQGYACAVCGHKQPELGKGPRSLHFDHSHTTGKPRGILCARCNQVLGRCKDDIGLLERLISYLRQY